MNGSHNPSVLRLNVEQKPTRDGFGEGLLILGERDKRVVALCADLTDSTRIAPFAEKFPERFVELGVAEQNLAAVASGMAAMGKIPFIASYAVFSPGRNWEQIRTTICYNNVPVKIAGAHAGVSVGPDGGSHQALEDIALMRVLPRMTVLSPCDAIEAKKAVIAAVEINGPVYIRLAREQTPIITTERTPFAVGKAEVFYQSKQAPRVAIVATGPLVYEALRAADKLEREIPTVVINCPSIKPLDEKTIGEWAKKCGAVVSVEEHQKIGGLGGALAEFLSSWYPVPIERVGVADQFGQSGSPSELLAHYQLNAEAIIEAVRKAATRRIV